jgi:hypothetical protein
VKVNQGIVSHGTTDPKELVVRFMEVLDDQKKRSAQHVKLTRDIIRRWGTKEYFESEVMKRDVELLVEALNDYAPDYFFFGSHPNNQSDYGYWLCEDWEMMMEDDGGVKVYDLDEVPPDHHGPVALVNDHGNVTMYQRVPVTIYRLRKLWEVV